jgi:hypothetical protein
MLCPAALSALFVFGEWHTMHAAKAGQGNGAPRTYELAWIGCLACIILATALLRVRGGELRAASPPARR